MKPRPSYSFSAELPSSSDTTSHSASHRSPGRHAIKLRLLQLHTSFLAIQSGQLQVTVCSASPRCLLPPQHLVVIYLLCRLFFYPTPLLNLQKEGLPPAQQAPSEGYPSRGSHHPAHKLSPSALTAPCLGDERLCCALTSSGQPVQHRV